MVRATRTSPRRVSITLSILPETDRDLLALSVHDSEPRSRVIERLVRAEAARLGLARSPGTVDSQNGGG